MRIYFFPEMKLSIGMNFFPFEFTFLAFRLADSLNDSLTNVYPQYIITSSVEQRICRTFWLVFVFRPSLSAALADRETTDQTTVDCLRWVYQPEGDNMINWLNCTYTDLFVKSNTITHKAIITKTLLLFFSFFRYLLWGEEVGPFSGRRGFPIKYALLLTYLIRIFYIVLPSMYIITK